MLARLKLPLPERPQRRTKAAARGARVDLRATLRRMTGAAGAVVTRVLVLCGSLQRISANRAAADVVVAAPAGQIALDCGFYDQSHFNRAFRAATGLRPLEYRKRFAPRVTDLDASVRG